VVSISWKRYNYIQFHFIKVLVGLLIPV
jgi:hypothetical protein